MKNNKLNLVDMVVRVWYTLVAMVLLMGVITIYNSHRTVEQIRINQANNMEVEAVGMYMQAFSNPIEDASKKGFYNTFFRFGSKQNEKGELQPYVKFSIEACYHSDFAEDIFVEDSFSEEYFMEDENFEEPIVMLLEIADEKLELIIDLELDVEETELKKLNPVLKITIGENHYIGEELEYQRKIIRKYELYEEGQMREFYFSDTEELDENML